MTITSKLILALFLGLISSGSFAACLDDHSKRDPATIKEEQVKTHEKKIETKTQSHLQAESQKRFENFLSRSDF